MNDFFLLIKVYYIRVAMMSQFTYYYFSACILTIIFK